MKKRVKAYTLMEVTIAMLLAGIVIMIAYTVFNIIVRTYATYNLRNKDMAQQVLLDELLKKDFSRSSVVFITDSGISCQTGQGVVNYEFESDYIVRTFSIIDTFKVNLQQAVFTFEHNEITPNEKRVQIDELKLDIMFRNRVNSNHYKKHYSSAELLKITDNALN